MKVSQLMSKNVICVDPRESVEVAARVLAQYNLGVLPVCREKGRLCGVVTDRDLVVRCMAASLSPKNTTVEQVMTGQVMSISPDADAAVAAHLMGRKQLRRLPVTQNGKVCGMVSLADLAGQEESILDAADALGDITKSLR